MRASSSITLSPSVAKGKFDGLEAAEPRRSLEDLLSRQSKLEVVCMILAVGLGLFNFYLIRVHSGLTDYVLDALIFILVLSAGETVAKQKIRGVLQEAA